jgi:hypothetical protein
MNTQIPQEMEKLVKFFTNICPFLIAFKFFHLKSWQGICRNYFEHKGVTQYHRPKKNGIS